jgi:hypothetical protein
MSYPDSKLLLKGPTRFLLIIGLLFTLGAVLAVYNYFVQLKELRGYTPSAWFLLRFFASPAVFLIEAMIYWRLRRYNEFPRASWAHCSFMLLAYCLPVFLIIPQLLQRSIIARNYPSRQESGRYLFWLTMIVAHAFFAWVVVGSIKNKRMPKALPENPENLLDDVFS